MALTWLSNKQPLNDPKLSQNMIICISLRIEGEGREEQKNLKIGEVGREAHFENGCDVSMFCAGEIVTKWRSAASGVGKSSCFHELQQTDTSAAIFDSLPACINNTSKSTNTRASDPFQVPGGESPILLKAGAGGRAGFDWGAEAEITSGICSTTIGWLRQPRRPRCAIQSG